MMQGRVSFGIVSAGLAVLLSGTASAQVRGVQVRDGEVFVQEGGSWSQITRGGRASEAAMSRDGSLVGYIRREGGDEDDPLNSISLCVVTTRSCTVIVTPRRDDAPEQNLTGASGLVFSYQARAEAGGGLIGSVFFLANGWGTSGGVHRVTLGPNPAITFVTGANSLSVVPAGRFSGALTISQHIYAPQGGSCDQMRIFDPNTRKVLQDIPTPDCQSLHIR